MSTNISVSNKNSDYCQKILLKFKKIGIDCRLQNTTSLIIINK